jgi:hypothetical protein
LYNNNLIHVVCFLIQTLENVQEEEKDDNNFDHRDDMSESLPTGDGGSGSGSKTGDEVDDGTSKAKKARKGGKKLVLHCLPSARYQEAKGQHVGNILLLLKCNPRRREVSWRPRQSASSAIGVICTIQVVPLLL